MAPIAGIPFLEHQLRLLKKQGIRDVVLAVSYMADKVESYFGDGRFLGLRLAYSEEEVPLGTAGALKKAENHFDSRFFVFNGDSYTQLNLEAFCREHEEKKNIYTMSVTETDEAVAYGTVVLEGDRIVAFREKQGSGSALINSGVYLFEPEILKRISPRENVSLENNVFPDLAREGLLHAHLYQGYFMDIGRPETYLQFKRDVVRSLQLSENRTLRDALSLFEERGIDLALVTDAEHRLIGSLTNADVRRTLVSSGSLEDKVSIAMQPVVNTATSATPAEKRVQMLASGISFLPILAADRTLDDVEFRAEEVLAKTFPIVRGRAPLRISFAGGGTDLPYYFNKHGGAVTSATIDKYCYGTLVKRADQQIIITSDISVSPVIASTLDDLSYNGTLDMAKAVIRRVSPDFGFELHLHNDVPPGRGLGSSAAVAGLTACLFDRMMGTRYSDEKLAEIAYLAEREELNIKGGWQDQYATLRGGFNYMEFTAESHRVLPLRLKEGVSEELTAHLLLCYVGAAHKASEVHTEQEQRFQQREKEHVQRLQSLKDLALKTRDVLASGELELLGRYLDESWKHKQSLASYISNPTIDTLYRTGIEHGSYGGKLLGAGNGGYLLFFYQPRRRHELVEALKAAGGEILPFRFEQEGTKVWESKNTF
jgi:D-glycero-alpha-D-manno-heptose-7-phosphate kinase